MYEGTSSYDLSDAQLGGLVCKASAWESATQIAVIEKEGKSQEARGIRTWRGVAVLDGEAAEYVQAMCNRASAYAGKVRIGEEELEVDAEVYITRMARQVVTEASRRGGDAKVYVEFTGAGNL